MIHGNLSVGGWQDSCAAAWKGVVHVASHPRVAAARRAGARIGMRRWFTDEPQYVWHLPRFLSVPCDQWEAPNRFAAPAAGSGSL